MKEYYEEYRNFCSRHGEHTIISEMINGITNKMAVFKDKAVWYEVYGKHTEITEITVKGVTLTVEIPLFRLEYWSTDNSASRTVYERY